MQLVRLKEREDVVGATGVGEAVVGVAKVGLPVVDVGESVVGFPVGCAVVGCAVVGCAVGLEKVFVKYGLTSVVLLNVIRIVRSRAPVKALKARVLNRSETSFCGSSSLWQIRRDVGASGNGDVFLCSSAVSVVPFIGAAECGSPFVLVELVAIRS